MDDEGKFQPLYHTAEREFRVRKSLMDAHEGKSPWRAIKGYWSMPDLQAVYDQLREAELVQALHRSRVNTRDTVVWMLTSVPTGESLDGIWDDPPLEAGFPEGIHWRQWLKLLPWLEKRREEGLPVTYDDLAEVTGVGIRHTQNNRWLDVIAARYPEQWATSELRPAQGRGRPKKALCAA
jgi:hypothetical protein